MMNDLDQLKFCSSSVALGHLHLTGPCHFFNFPTGFGMAMVQADGVRMVEQRKVT